MDSGSVSLAQVIGVFDPQHVAPVFMDVVVEYFFDANAHVLDLALFSFSCSTPQRKTLFVS